MPSAPGEQATNDGNEGSAGTGSNAGESAEKARFYSADEVDRKLNQALTARDKRFKQQLDEKLAELAQLRQSKDQSGQSDEQSATGDRATSMKLEKLAQELAQEREQRKTIEQKARQERAEGSLKSKLSERARPETAGLLLDVLRARGYVSTDESGTPSLKFPHSFTKGQKPEVTEFDLEEGLEILLKNPEFAVFLPPPSNGGSGAGPARRNGTPSYRQKPRDQWSEADEAEAYRDRLNKKF